MSKNFASATELARHILERGRSYPKPFTDQRSVENLERLAQGVEDDYIIFSDGYEGFLTCASEKDQEHRELLLKTGLSTVWCWTPIRKRIEFYRREGSRTAFGWLIGYRYRTRHKLHDVAVMEPAFLQRVAWVDDYLERESDNRIRVGEKRLAEEFEDVANLSWENLPHDLVVPKGVAHPVERWKTLQKRLIALCEEEGRPQRAYSAQIHLRISEEGPLWRPDWQDVEELLNEQFLKLER